jgi:CubicO group peptidase (beta-lactamase class C family)
VNFLVLGLLLEQVTGRSYDDLLTDSILRPLHLTNTTHLASEPGAPRGGAAGIASTLPDLLVASDGLLRRHSLVSETAWTAMAGFDLYTGLGAGIAGYCPCTVTADGTHKFFSVGFTGSSTFLAYVPSLDVAVSIEVGDDFSTLSGRFLATTNLIRELATTLAAAH